MAILKTVAVHSDEAVQSANYRLVLKQSQMCHCQKCIFL